MVIHKDEGFIFAKRINASGDLSKEVICLTIRYPSETFSLELDAEQAESIIFQDEASFDPFKQGKELAKKKNKARKLNKSKVIIYETAQESLDFLSNLKKGDKVFDAGTTFGEGIVQWEVSDVVIRNVDKTPMTDWRNKVYAHGNTDIDQKHNRNNLNTYCHVELTIIGEPPKSRRWISRARNICFTDFLSSTKHRDYYSSRPTTIDEV
jgi:formylmethanofuran dehydrogenase subunit D